MRTEQLSARPSLGDSTPASLRMRGVSKSFLAAPAVRDFDLDLRLGEIVSIIGPSGSGKTTTLRLVAGLERPDTGYIEIGGRNCAGIPPEQRRVGFVFQDYALFPHLTVAENIGFGLARLPRHQRAARVREMLELVELAGLESRLPRELSGGQQQRVALARAIAPHPSLLLLDEPLSNLDPQMKREVRHEVLSIVRSSGAAALWVTHDHDEGLIVADRVVVMREGRIRQAGAPAEVWRRPADAWVARFIGQGDLVPGVVGNALVRTPLGTVKAAGLKDGTAVQVLVRPSDLVIDPSGHPGTVVRRHFSGDDLIYCVQLKGGALLHCLQPSGRDIPRGTEIRIRLASDSLVVFA